MSTWFASGQVIDTILLLMLAEGALLWFLRARYGRGLPPRAILTLLTSGAALMLALRAALTGAPWEHVSGFLVGGLVAHLVDVANRWD
jgi:hypothetical protein